jgi:hypothetical protein
MGHSRFSGEVTDETLRQRQYRVLITAVSALLPSLNHLPGQQPLLQVQNPLDCPGYHHQRPLRRST